MSTYTRQIVVSHGIHGPVTRRDNGGVIYPGWTVTSEGQTFPDIITPTAAANSVLGIAGCNANHDVDTIYADNDEFPVFLCGSGAIVYGYHKGTAGGGSIVDGEILVAYGAGSAGQVISLAKAWNVLTGDVTNTIMATTITRSLAIVGRAAETHASAANTVPIKILLSV